MEGRILELSAGLDRHVSEQALPVVFDIAKPGISAIDLQDPKAVAKAFVHAMLDGDKAKAASHVEEEDRDDFVATWRWDPEAIERANFPTTLQIEIISEHENDRDVRVVGTELVFDMNYHHHRWWIGL